MAETSKILEGVFAISKPPSISSAQVIRDLQQHFVKSKIFAPLLAETNRRHELEDRQYGKRRRRDADAVFKIGHGGTLDPLATGVLIIGIGRGTKHLQSFLGCTKQYDTVVLFGKSTDTYDIMGKIVGDAPFAQITQDEIEEKLGQFRGHIKQVPPVYSALKINGMKAYEYARSGKELPRELESRDMEVQECRLVEYLEGGQHDFRWPAAEAPEEEKAAVSKLMKSAGGISGGQEAKPEPETAAESGKDQSQTSVPDTILEGHAQSSEKLADVPSESTEQATATDAPEAIESGSMTDLPSQPPHLDTTVIKVQDTESTRQDSATEKTATQETASQETTKAATINPQSNDLAPEIKASLHTHFTPALSTTPSPSPAARISLVVSSGFYVRSFAHDLGISLGSYGIMAELTRSRQGDFVIPSLATQYPDLTPSLTYDDLAAGEETWAPLIQDVLEKWMANHPLPGQPDADGNIRPDDRDRKWNGYGGRDGGRRYGGRNWGRGKGRSGGSGSSGSNWQGNRKRDRD